MKKPVLLALGMLTTLSAQHAHANPMSGDWRITAEDGSTLGTLEVERAGGASAFQAYLRVWLSMGGSVAHEGRTRVRRSTGEAIDITLRAGSGQVYRLLLALPRQGSNTSAGSLFDGETLKPVSLSRQAAAMPGQEDDFVEDRPEEFDLPGVGVSGPAYRLIGIPAGKRLTVRKTANRDAAAVGTLPADATEILVAGCEPYVEAYRYEELSDAGKRQVLDSSWCEIRHETMTGFIPGRYLEAIAR